MATDAPGVNAQRYIWLPEAQGIKMKVCGLVLTLLSPRLALSTQLCHQRRIG